MHTQDSLESLAARIHSVTSAGKRYKVSSGSEHQLLSGLDAVALQEFATAAVCQVVPRLGGTVFEFTRAGAA